MEDLAVRSHERILTETDYVQLTRLLSEEATPLPGVDDVQRVLQESTRVASYPISSGLVAMHAQVFLVPEPQEQLVRVTLSYPDEEDPARGRISVLSPLGASLLGMSAGQTATWHSFGRVNSAHILGVLAPLQADGGDEE